MDEFVFYLISFASVYIFYFFLVLMNKKTLKKYENSAEILYLKKKYDMKITSKNIDKVAFHLAILNSFVVANTVLIVILISSNYIIMMLVGFIVVIPMILLVYHLYGKSNQNIDKSKK